MVVLAALGCSNQYTLDSAVATSILDSALSHPTSFHEVAQVVILAALEETPPPLPPPISTPGSCEVVREHTKSAPPSPGKAVRGPRRCLPVMARQSAEGQ